MEFDQKTFSKIDLFDFTSFLGLDFFKFSGPLCFRSCGTDFELQQTARSLSYLGKKGGSYFTNFVHIWEAPKLLNFVFS